MDRQIIYYIKQLKETTGTSYFLLPPNSPFT